MIRRWPPGPLRIRKFWPQYGVLLGSELPDRMLAMSQAACGLQTLLGLGSPASKTVLPSGVLDLEDVARIGHLAAVAEGAVGRDHVDEAHLDGADGAGQAGPLDAPAAGEEADARLGGVLVERLAARGGRGPGWPGC